MLNFFSFHVTQIKAEHLMSKPRNEINGTTVAVSMLP